MAKSSKPIDTTRASRGKDRGSAPQAAASPSSVASHQTSQSCQTVVTNVTAHNGAPLIAAPLIPGVTGYDMQTASLLTGLTRGYIRWLLHTYPERFDKRHIQLRRVSNRPSSRWPKRILTNRDIVTLRDMYPVVVKEIPPR